MSKYEKLYDYLITKTSSQWNTTFTELEKILGFKLPKSAYTYPAWWANNIDSHVQKLSWLKAR